ncbi:hypothetical protein Nepgr_023814 [Nepenthes gracilis]|uniref:Uncharacterized protein n=1 Tax=Nepenthes gracilis TaxID=150966 RepID=A0AAD3T3I2_NEPGR|nr:hypothetical protein Nepgr_023814 [Nepenthes gracilis]
MASTGVNSTWSVLTSGDVEALFAQYKIPSSMEADVASAVPAELREKPGSLVRHGPSRRLAKRWDSSFNSSMSENQAALKRLRGAGSSSRRRALTNSESLGHLLEVVVQVVGGKPLAPSVPAVEVQGAEAEAVPIPTATLAQFGVPIVAY